MSFFFVLSGFVLRWSYGSRRAITTFWRGRVARLWPSHLVAVAAALIVAATLVPVIRTQSPWALLANLFLVNAWRDDWWQAGNPVSWTLSVECFFYAAFPFLVPIADRLARRYPRRGVACILAIVALVPVVAHVAFGVDTATTAHNPLLRLPEFFLGMALATVVRTDVRLPSCRVAVSMTVVGYALSCQGVFVWLGSAQWIVPGFALLIAALARRDVSGRPSHLASRRMVRLGELSFGFYLMHLLVIAALGSPWPSGHPNLPPLPASLLAAAAFVTALGLAWLMNTCVERPARALMLRRLPS